MLPPTLRSRDDSSHEGTPPGGSSDRNKGALFSLITLSPRPFSNTHTRYFREGTHRTLMGVL